MDETKGMYGGRRAAQRLLNRRWAKLHATMQRVERYRGRSETLAKLPKFKEALAKLTLMPAWQHEKGAKRSEGRNAAKELRQLRARIAACNDAGKRRRLERRGRKLAARLKAGK